MTLAIALSVLLVACTAQSAFGFGLALVAVPLLSGTLPFALVTPLLALLSMTLGAAVAWRSRGAVRLDLWWRLLLAATLGVPLGILFVAELPEGAIRLALGVVVLLAGLRGLIVARASRAEDSVVPARASVPGSVWPFGLAAGVLGGAWNLMGPPLVLFMQRARLDPGAFRATLHAFSFAINAVIVGGWLIRGSVSGDVRAATLLSWYAAALAPLALGALLGGWLVTRVDTRRYRQAVDLLLVVTGAGLVAATLGEIAA